MHPCRSDSLTHICSYWGRWVKLAVINGDWTIFMRWSILCPLMLLWFMFMVLLGTAWIPSPFSSFHLDCDVACSGPLHSSDFIKWFVVTLYLQKETAFNMKSIVLCYTHPTILANILWVIIHEISNILCWNICFLNKLFPFVGYLSRDI